MISLVRYCAFGRPVKQQLDAPKAAQPYDGIDNARDNRCRAAANPGYQVKPYQTYKQPVYSSDDGHQQGKCIHTMSPLLNSISHSVWLNRLKLCAFHRFGTYSLIQTNHSIMMFLFNLSVKPNKTQ